MKQQIIQSLIYLVCAAFSIWKAYGLGFGCGEDKGRKDMQKFMTSKPPK